MTAIKIDVGWEEGVEAAYDPIIFEPTPNQSSLADNILQLSHLAISTCGEVVTRLVDAPKALAETVESTALNLIGNSVDTIYRLRRLTSPIGQIANNFGFGYKKK